MNNEILQSHVALLKRYLKDRDDTGMGFMGYPFVTIARQASAGGHTLARAILKEMDKQADNEMFRGWEMFDQQLCALLAQDTDLHATFESLVAEEYKSATQQTIYEMFLGTPQQYKTNKKIFEVIRMLASTGKVLLVGRAGCFVARDLPGGIHIRLVASELTRAKWMAKQMGITVEEAQATCHKQDAERAHMVRDYFNRDVENPLNYDCVWNAETLPTEEVAAAIVLLIKNKWKQMHKNQA